MNKTLLRDVEALAVDAVAYDEKAVALVLYAICGAMAKGNTHELMDVVAIFVQKQCEELHIRGPLDEAKTEWPDLI